MMRTTLDIEDDVLAAAKELARRQGISAGQVVSRLLRSALSGGVEKADAGSAVVAGFRPFHAASLQLVTDEQIDQLRDQDGLGGGMWRLAEACDHSVAHGGRFVSFDQRISLDLVPTASAAHLAMIDTP